jgi:putative flippase GtrA
MPLLNNLFFKFRNFLLNRHPKFYCFCDSRRPIVKFFISGCFGSISDLILLFIFHGIFKLDIVVSTSLAYILSFIVIFTLQKFWTFQNYNQHQAYNQLILYFLNTLVGLALNGFLMHYFVNGLYVWYMFSQLIVNLIIGTYNFIIYKFIIFKIGCYEINRQTETTK